MNFHRRTTPPRSRNITKTTENRFHRNVSASLRHHHPSLVTAPTADRRRPRRTVLTMFEPISGSNASTVMCQLRGPSSLSLAAAAHSCKPSLVASKSTFKRPEFRVWHQPHSFAFIMTTPRGFTTFRLPMVPGMAAPSPRRSDYKRHIVFDIKQGKASL